MSTRPTDVPQARTDATTADTAADTGTFTWMGHIPVLGHIARGLDFVWDGSCKLVRLLNQKIPTPPLAMNPFEDISDPFSSKSSALDCLLYPAKALWVLGACLLSMAIFVPVVTAAFVVKYGIGLPLAVLGFCVQGGYALADIICGNRGVFSYAEPTSVGQRIGIALRQRLLSPFAKTARAFLHDGLRYLAGTGICLGLTGLNFIRVVISPLAVLVTLPVRAVLTLRQNHLCRPPVVDGTGPAPAGAACAGAHSATETAETSPYGSRPEERRLWPLHADRTPCPQSTGYLGDREMSPPWSSPSYRR